jgi:hypothetical protein
MNQDAAFAGDGAKPNMPPGDYRRYAAECLRLAENFTDAEDRMRLIDMAMAWLLLAQQAERNPIEPEPEDE